MAGGAARVMLRRSGSSYTRITVGRSGVEDVRTCRPMTAAHLTTSTDDARGAEGDWGMTHRLLDRVGCQLRMLAQQRPLVGMIAPAPAPRRPTDGGWFRCRRSGGAAASDEQLVVGEAVAVVFGADQLRDQVVGEATAAGRRSCRRGRHPVPPRRAQDDRLILGDGEVETLEDVLGPVREPLPVRGGGRPAARR